MVVCLLGELFAPSEGQGEDRSAWMLPLCVCAYSIVVGLHTVFTQAPLLLGREVSLGEQLLLTLTLTLTLALALAVAVAVAVALAGGEHLLDKLDRHLEGVELGLGVGVGVGVGAGLGSLALNPP
jgi:hypothetical protein